MRQEKKGVFYALKYCFCKMRINELNYFKHIACWRTRGDSMNPQSENNLELTSYRLTLLLAFQLLILIAPVSADDHLYSDENRTIFSSPRSAALAGSDRVFANDASPFTNPAMLGYEDRAHQVALSYAGFFGNTFSTSILSSRMKPDPASGIGISLSYLYVPDIQTNLGFDLDPASGEPVYDPSKIVSSFASDLYFRCGYGHRFTGLLRAIDFGLGAAITAKRSNLVGWTGYGIGVDGGGYVSFAGPGIAIGLYGENLTTSYLYWSSAYQDVAWPHARLGIGWKKDIRDIYGRIQLTYESADFLGNDGINSLMAGDESDTTVMPERVRLSEDPASFLMLGKAGAEYTIFDRVALRIGVGLPNAVSFGGGMYLFDRSFTVDFAYLVHELAGTYQLGISYQW